MDGSDDYEEEQHLSSDGSPARFQRPVFIRQGTDRNLNREKRVKKCQKRTRGASRKKELEKSCFGPLLLVQENFESSQKSFSKQESSESSEGARESVQYYEYGDPISGYRFIGTEKQFQDFESLKSEKTPSFEYEPLERPHGMSRVSVNTCDYIARYWNQDKDRKKLYFPILNANSVDRVDIDDLTRDRVERFYLRSCSQLGLDLPLVLKRERLKWHPDRLVGKLAPGDVEIMRKITRLFQIINDLWESQ